MSSLASNNEAVTYLLEQNDGTIYRFNKSGLPYQINFPNAKGSVGLSFDAQSRLRQAGKLVFTYSDDNRLLAVSDSLTVPRRVQFEYDQLGRLASVTNRLGYVTRYTYAGETSHLHEIVDARGHTALSMEYDERGRTIRQQNTRSLQEGKAITFAYEQLDDGTHRTTSVDPPSTLAPSFPVTVIDELAPGGEVTTRRTETGPGDEPVVETRRVTRSAPGVKTELSGGKRRPRAAGGTPLAAVTIPWPHVSADGEGRMLASRWAPICPASGAHGAADPPVASRPGRRTDHGSGRTSHRGSCPGRGRFPRRTWRIEYDDEDQVLSITQQGATERTVTYQYDEVGNVVETVGTNGRVRQYEYDDRDSLTGLRTAAPPGATSMTSATAWPALR